MKKRIVCLLTSLALCLSLTLPAQAADYTWNTDAAAQEKGYQFCADANWYDHVEIDGMYDIGYVQYADADYATVCYCTVPARVTVLERVIDYGGMFEPVTVTCAEPMYLGGSMVRYTLTDSGKLVKQGAIEPTHLVPVESEEFGTVYGAGSYWELDEGIYFMFSVESSKTLFLVVGSPDNVTLPDTSDAYITLEPGDLDYVHITGTMPDTGDGEVEIDEYAFLVSDDSLLSIALPEGGTYFVGTSMLHFPGGDGDPFNDQPLVNAPVSSNGMYTYRVFDADEELRAEFVYITESYAAKLREMGYTITSVSGEPQAEFTDVTPADWFYEPVSWAVATEITNGIGGGAFSPYQTCTQGQILTFLWRAAGEPEPTQGSVYSNAAVTADQYYYKALLWAWETGLVSNKALDPKADCQRSDVVTYLWKLEGSPRTGTSSFTDVPASASYADAVAWAVDAGITQGTGNGAFSPTAACTRGHIVTFLYRYFVEA